ncbi:MAG: hypothetical protein R3279_11690, partial [Putridiphycobacter sp.]|nr:hypothetical protein [Putridiphycobacter sp.]
MKYILTYDQPHHQNLKISAHFKIVNKKSTILSFPKWRPGRYEYGNFAKNITQFKVVDDLNNPLTFIKINDNEWEINTENCKEIIVSYYYYAAELNAGSTFISPDQLYVNPVNCLIYRETEQDLPCELILNVPADFQIACGLPFENNRLVTKNYHELVDTPFIASPTLQHYQYKLGP